MTDEIVKGLICVLIYFKFYLVCRVLYVNVPFSFRSCRSFRVSAIIPTEDIHHFETKDSLSFLVKNKGNHFSIDYTLDQLETLVQPKQFFRINRKIILNIQSIEKVSTYFNSRLAITAKFLDNEARIVSRERVNDFKKWLDN